MSTPPAPARTPRQRGAGRWFNPQVQQQVRQMYRRGTVSHRQIADEIGCSRYTVSALLRAPQLAATVAPLTPEMVQRYERGEESIAELAARLDCYYVMARRLLINAGANVPDDDNDRLRTEIVRRYTAERQSIRKIAAALRRSYCFVQMTLTGAKVRMRYGGRRTAVSPTTSSPADRRPRTTRG